MTCTTAAAAAAAAVLGCLVGLVCTHPVHPEVCDPNCSATTTQRHLQFSHVLELQNKSIAPWTLGPSQFDRRIQEARCETCKDPCLQSEPIRIRVSLTRSKRNHTTGDVTYCLCHYEIAVGCTCVPKSAPPKTKTKTRTAPPQSGPASPTRKSVYCAE